MNILEIILHSLITTSFCLCEELDNKIENEKNCRERNRLITTDKGDIFMLVDAIPSQKLTLQCHYCKENDDEQPKVWYKMKTLRNSQPEEVTLGMDSNSTHNRIHVNLEHSLMFRNVSVNDTGFYYCIGLEGQESRNRYSYLIDTVFENETTPETGNLTKWRKYHDEYFGPVNKLFKSSATRDFSYIRETLLLSVEVVTEWEPWGPCEVCGRSQGDGRRRKKGFCRLKLTPNNVNTLLPSKQLNYFSGVNEEGRFFCILSKTASARGSVSKNADFKSTTILVKLIWKAPDAKMALNQISSDLDENLYLGALGHVKDESGISSWKFKKVLHPMSVPKGPSELQDFEANKTVIPHNDDEVLLLDSYELSCRSLVIDRLFSSVSRVTKFLPHFVQLESCDGVCNPDAEGLSKGWKAGKGFKYRKSYVLAENAHLTLICPESTLENAVVWRRNGKILKSGESVQPPNPDDEPRIIVDTFNTLYLHGVTVEEEGNYTCQVDDIKMQQIKIFVVSKSRILTQAFVRHMMYLAFVLSLTFSCYCAGLFVTWTRRHSFKTYEELLKENAKAYQTDDDSD